MARSGPPSKTKTAEAGPGARSRPRACPTIYRTMQRVEGYFTVTRRRSSSGPASYFGSQAMAGDKIACPTLW
jgi:hypothetical protein